MINRVHEQIQFTNGVAVGAVHAMEAGFSGKTPRALKKYQEALLRSVKKLSGAKTKDADAKSLFDKFGGLGAVEKRNGRRKNNT